MRRLTIGAILSIAAVATASGPGSAPQATFRARTDVVAVAVSVTRDRNAVTGLTPPDFELTDNGVRQVVDSASLDRVPIDLTLVLTAFPVDRTTDHDGDLVNAATTRRLLLADDRLRVVTIDDDVRGGLVTADYSLAADPVVRSWARGRAVGRGFSMEGGKSGWGVALADGLFYALTWPVEPERRHLIVAFTDGWDTASAIELPTLPKLAARSDAVLHAVFWRTPGEDDRNAGGRNIVTSNRTPLNHAWQASFNTMDAVVQTTGGRLHRARNASESLAEIVADFRSSYVLRYTARGVPLAGWHELKVKVTRPGSYSVRSRKGYEAGR